MHVSDLVKKNSTLKTHIADKPFQKFQVHTNAYQCALYSKIAFP